MMSAGGCLESLSREGMCVQFMKKCDMTRRKYNMLELKAVTESYPHTLPLKDGRLTSDKVHLNVTEFKFAHEAFDDQVENQRYDVC